MKTSSYEDPYEETDNVGADTVEGYEVPVSEVYVPSESNKASTPLTYEESLAMSYEASFAKCKVAGAAAVSHEDFDAEIYEAFAKCSLAPVTETNEERQITEDEAPENRSASFTRCSLQSKTHVNKYEETVAEKSEEQPVADTTEAQLVAKMPEAKPIAEIHETANVTPETNYTPSFPPPVPKRTLLPSRSAKETIAAPVAQQEIPVGTEEVETQNVAYRDIELISPEDTAHKVETGAERWSDSTSVSLPGQVEDIETVSSDPGKSQCEPVSEMYYTASSEVSLLSDTDLVDKVQTEDDESKDDRKNVMLGHVAAMRERFESMTRTNTPCPDLARSLSPSLEVFRNMSPTPDRLA